MKTKTGRPWGRIIGISLVVLVVLVVVGGMTLRRKIPKDLMLDIRSGIAARDTKDPDARLEKYLEGRFGPQDDPANRQKVFTNMFNPEHIKSMQFLVSHSPKDQRQTNVMAMAKWLENYRNNLKPNERASLAAQLNSDAGKSMLQQATALYNTQDVHYRSMTAPVISQLLTTVAQLQKR